MGRLTGIVLVGALAVLVAGCGSETSAAEGGGPIAFSSNQGGAWSVVLVDADGSGRIRVKKGARSPSWSPDSQQLAVTRGDGRTTDIVVISADGSEERAVTSGDEGDDGPVFSPDGEWIAFSRTTSLGEAPLKAGIHVVRPEGSELRAVTSGDAYDREPAWSPDGRRLAFTRVVVRGERLVSHVFVVDADGANERRLVQGGAPTWAPDGRRIAYVSGKDGFGETCFHECRASGEIYVLDADGGGDKRVTRSKADDRDPAWTADGGQILFSSDRSDPGRHDYELWAMTAEGDCATRLTNASSWSR